MIGRKLKKEKKINFIIKSIIFPTSIHKQKVLEDFSKASIWKYWTITVGLYLLNLSIYNKVITIYT